MGRMSSLCLGGRASCCQSLVFAQEETESFWAGGQCWFVSLFASRPLLGGMIHSFDRQQRTNQFDLIRFTMDAPCHDATMSLQRCCCYRNIDGRDSLVSPDWIMMTCASGSKNTVATCSVNPACRILDEIQEPREMIGTENDKSFLMLFSWT